MGIIKQYRAILNPEKLNLGTAAFILASVSYRAKNLDETPISQRQVAEEIAQVSRSPRSPHNHRRLGFACEASGRKRGCSRQICRRQTAVDQRIRKDVDMHGF